MESFKIQIAALSPCALRALARWQRSMLTRRNPLLSGMLANMTDAEIAASYFRDGATQRARILAETEKRRHVVVFSQALASVHLVSVPRWTPRASFRFGVLA
jgi:hypothetical protein